jgi:hypothetical protein
LSCNSQQGAAREERAAPNKSGGDLNTAKEIFMGKDDFTIESDVKTIESMLGIGEMQVWAYQRLEESIERLKHHYNELDEHSKGIFNLGLLELENAAQAGEEW